MEGLVFLWLAAGGERECSPNCANNRTTRLSYEVLDIRYPRVTIVVSYNGLELPQLTYSCSFFMKRVDGLIFRGRTEPKSIENGDSQEFWASAVTDRDEEGAHEESKMRST